MNKVEKVITWTESKLLASRAHKNPEAVFSNLLKIQKKYARITRGEWGYTVFNCSYMANMANLAFMCLAQGKIPIMDFHAETEYPSNDWSTFFRQPFIWGGQELNMNDIESVNVTNGVYRISSRSIS